jgi:putative membrane protein
MHYYWFGWGHMIWMTIAWLVGIGLLVALIWAILQAASGRSRETESPEAILKRRYAAGEIDTEEYNRRLAVLKNKNVARRAFTAPSCAGVANL